MAKEEKSAAELYREERKERLAKSAKKNQKKANKVKLGKGGKIAICILLVVAIAAGIGGYAFSNSGIIEKNKIAMSVGENEISQPELEYYYIQALNTYFNYSYQYDSSYGTGYGKMVTGYDYTVSPDEQEYTLGEIDGFPEDQTPMWTDYFEYYAKSNVQYIKGMLAYAKENNIVIEDEDQKKIDDYYDQFIESVDSSNENAGTKYSPSAYLRNYYGKGLTVKLYKQILTEQVLASKVSEIKTNEYKDSYTNKQVNKEYNSNIQNYGVVTYRAYTITAETVEDEEGTAAATKETLAAAKAKADEFAAAVTDEASFKKLASESEKAAGSDKYKEYLTDDTKTLYEDTAYSSASVSENDDFNKWIFSADTANGATYVVDNGSTGSTIYMMINPVHKAADTLSYDVRHILIKFPEEEETTTEEATTEATTVADDTTAADEANDTTEATTTEETTTEATTAETTTEPVKVEPLDLSKYSDVNVILDVDADSAKDKATYQKAQDILKEYLDGDHTADAFGALAKKYTEDSNGDDGGLYEGVEEGQMVTEFESWCLADGRKEGDVGIVESSYGYHVMYFVKSVTTTWSDTIKTALASNDLNDFSEKISKGDNVAVSNENAEVIATVTNAGIALAKSMIKQVQSASSSASY